MCLVDKQAKNTTVAPWNLEPTSQVWESRQTFGPQARDSVTTLLCCNSCRVRLRIILLKKPCSIMHNTYIM